MEFANPRSVYLLWLSAIIIAFYFWSFKKRKKAMDGFAGKELAEKLAFSLDKKRRKIKMFLFLLSVFFCLFSLMEPRWGFHWEEVKKKGLDILIAIDTSKSMLAEDVKPNRLERSKLAIKDLIKKLKGDRIGLIAFSGSAFLQCPLTVDYSGFMLSLDNLSVDTIPKGGTSISSAVKEAVKSYEGGRKKYKILVLITDGEDHGGDPVETAGEAEKNGIKIFCIGIGTKEGELIPLAGEKNNKEFLKDKQGNAVKTRLDEVTLQKIALNTGGSYVKATGAEFGLDLIYEKNLSKMEKREFESKMRKRYENRFQVPLTFAVMLLLLEPFISERKILK